MAHVLLLDVPGGNDFTVLEDAVELGHEVTFFTADLDHYRRLGTAAQASLALARQLVEIPGFEYAAVEHAALSLHRVRPFHAILCLIDIRLIEASRLAQALGLRFLNPAAARLLRDKFSVREALARHGVRQPAYALADDIEQLHDAVAAVGYPALVKPSDGYGSQNIAVLESAADLDGLAATLEMQRRRPTDYGLGVRANNRLVVERYLRGRMIGCDVFVGESERVFLGINDKRMFAPPSFAISGSCFPSDRFDLPEIRAYAFQILDALDFDFGATHIEMIIAEDGPHLVEVNPRLVSAQIPFQMGYALGRSLYGELIHLHLGHSLQALRELEPACFCAIRWLVAEKPGILASVVLPARTEPWIRRVVIFKQPGQAVVPPANNGDRIAYVMATGVSQAEAELRAETCLAATRLQMQ
jgi:biotin carboxylase